MARFKVYIEYEGTRYSGWQKQQNAKTIQGTIIKAASEIFKTDFVFQGSGRTDSGVHALCQVAHLDVTTMLAPEIIRMKINDLLPSDINILEIEKTNKNFHARHDAISRSYIYQISKRRTAFAKNFVWWIKDKLDVKSMEKGLKLFEGMHDFASFSDKDEEEKSTKVMIEKVELTETNNLILIRISGSHFLWKMVRRMVGVTVEIGRGKLKSGIINYYLTNKSTEPVKFTAPPSGLFLEKVLYKKDEVFNELAPITLI